jgi:hypothetical protein
MDVCDGNLPCSSHTARAHALCAFSALASSILFGKRGLANERASGRGPNRGSGGGSVCDQRISSPESSATSFAFFFFDDFDPDLEEPVPTKSSKSS